MLMDVCGEPRAILTKSKKLKRGDVTDAMTMALRRLRFVHAFWEGGSAAFNRVDRWSDLDLYLLVDEGRVSDTFKIVESTLGELSPISLTYEVESGFEGVSQKFYRLKNIDEFSIIDLAVLTPSSPENFLTSEIHGDNVFYFNKGNAAQAKPLDKTSLTKRRRRRLDRLVLRFEMFNNYVIKELERGHSLEALEDYRAITLATLVEALRMRQSPLHFDFRIHYVDRELTPEAVSRLVRLSYVRDPDELREKYAEATTWCRKALREALHEA
jgi:predicted nucleotidyltransferase